MRCPVKARATLVCSFVDIYFSFWRKWALEQVAWLMHVNLGIWVLSNCCAKKGCMKKYNWWTSHSRLQAEQADQWQLLWSAGQALSEAEAFISPFIGLISSRWAQRSMFKVSTWVRTRSMFFPSWLRLISIAEGFSESMNPDFGSMFWESSHHRTGSDKAPDSHHQAPGCSLTLGQTPSTQATFRDCRKGNR